MTCCLVLTATAILNMLKTAESTDDLLILLSNIIHVVEVSMDGTSGALYAIVSRPQVVET
jgi:dihydroxyacetone kinase